MSTMTRPSVWTITVTRRDVEQYAEAWTTEAVEAAWLTDEEAARYRIDLTVEIEGALLDLAKSVTVGGYVFEIHEALIETAAEHLDSLRASGDIELPCASDYAEDVSPALR